MDKSALKIGILGGSFDPVHIGHLAIAEQARVEYALDRVLFVPARRSPLKQETVAGEQDRVAMLKLALAGNAGFKISAVELDRGGPSYTYDTIVALRNDHPGASFFFIIGEDAFAEITAWRRAADLSGLAVFLVAPRSSQVPAEPPIQITWHPLSSAHIAVSSTMIRERIKNGGPVRYLVPDAVLNYIQRERLYGTV